MSDSPKPSHRRQRVGPNGLAGVLAALATAALGCGRMTPPPDASMKEPIPMTTATVRCERTDSIATLTLSNPGKLNALNAAMWQELRRAVLQLAGDADIRCVILRGAGEVFAAGGDIEELREARATVDSALAYHEAVGQVLQMCIRDRPSAASPCAPA